MTAAQRAAALADHTKETKRLLPFETPSNTIQAELDHGWMRRAQLKVPMKVDGSSVPLTMESHIWMDGKIVGFVVAGDFLGIASGNTERRSGGKKVQAPSFLAQQLHAKTYDGVDCIGRGAKLYGISFNMVPWHKHLICTTINLNIHAMWVTSTTWLCGLTTSY